MTNKVKPSYQLYPADTKHRFVHMGLPQTEHTHPGASSTRIAELAIANITLAIANRLSYLTVDGDYDPDEASAVVSRISDGLAASAIDPSNNMFSMAAVLTPHATSAWATTHAATVRGALRPIHDITVPGRYVSPVISNTGLRHASLVDRNGLAIETARRAFVPSGAFRPDMSPKLYVRAAYPDSVHTEAGKPNTTRPLGPQLADSITGVWLRRVAETMIQAAIPLQGEVPPVVLTRGSGVLTYGPDGAVIGESVANLPTGLPMSGWESAPVADNPILPAVTASIPVCTVEGADGSPTRYAWEFSQTFAWLLDCCAATCALGVHETARIPLMDEPMVIQFHQSKARANIARLFDIRDVKDLTIKDMHRRLEVSNAYPGIGIEGLLPLLGVSVNESGAGSPARNIAAPASDADFPMNVVFRRLVAFHRAARLYILDAKMAPEHAAAFKSAYTARTDNICGYEVLTVSGCPSLPCVAPVLNVPCAVDWCQADKARDVEFVENFEACLLDKAKQAKTHAKSVVILGNAVTAQALSDWTIKAGPLMLQASRLRELPLPEWIAEIKNLGIPPYKRTPAEMAADTKECAPGTAYVPMLRGWEAARKAQCEAMRAERDKPMSVDEAIAQQLAASAAAAAKRAEKKAAKGSAPLTLPPVAMVPSVVLRSHMVDPADVDPVVLAWVEANRESAVEIARALSALGVQVKC